MTNLRHIKKQVKQQNPTVLLDDDEETSSGNISLHDVKSQQNSSQIENPYENGLNSQTGTQETFLQQNQQAQSDTYLNQAIIQQFDQTSQATGEKDVSTVYVQNQSQVEKQLQIYQITLQCSICGKQEIVETIKQPQQEIINHVCQSCYEEFQQILKQKEQQINILNDEVKRLTPEIKLHLKINRLERKTNFTVQQYNDDIYDNFPLLFDSLTDNIDYMEQLINAERNEMNKLNIELQQSIIDNTIQQHLPSYKMLTLQLILYQVYKYFCQDPNSNQQTKLRTEQLRQQLIDDFLCDICDQDQYNKQVQTDMNCIVEIKEFIIKQQYTQAINVAINNNLYDMAYYLCQKYNISQQEQINEQYTNYLNKKLETDLFQQINQQSNSSTVQNIFNLIGFYLMSQDEQLIKIMLQKVKQINDKRIKQLIYIVCHLPLIYSSEFEYIDIYDNYQGIIQQNRFQQLLNKLSRQYLVPNVIQLRLSEIYEFSFSKRNQFIKQKDIDQIKLLIQLKYNQYFDKQQLFTPSIIQLPFFTHLSVLKTALCGVSRKYCPQDQSLTQIILLYLEQIGRNLQYLVQYEQENNLIQEQEDSDDQFDDTISTLQIGQLPFKLSTYNVCYPFTAMSQGSFGQLMKYVLSFRKEIKNMKIINYAEDIGSVFIDVEQQSTFQYFLGKQIQLIQKQTELSGQDDGLEINCSVSDDSIINLTQNEIKQIEQKVEQQQHNQVKEEEINTTLQEIQQTPFNDLTFQSPSMLNRDQITPNNMNFVSSEILKNTPDIQQLQPQEIQKKSNLQVNQFLNEEQEQQQNQFIPIQNEVAPAFSDSEDQNQLEIKQNQQQIQQPQEQPKQQEQQKQPKQESKQEEKHIFQKQKKQKKQDDVIVADVGKKLSRKWSDTYNAWVQLDEKGNEIPPKKEVFELPPTVQSQQQQQQQEIPQQQNTTTVQQKQEIQQQPIDDPFSQQNMFTNPFSTPLPPQNKQQHSNKQRRYASAMK